jgi:hypothetical protein
VKAAFAAETSFRFYLNASALRVQDLLPDISKDNLNNNNEALLINITITFQELG